MARFYKKWGYKFIKKLVHIILSLMVFNSIRILFLKAIGVKVGDNSFVSRLIKLDFWWRLKIGSNCYLNENIYLDCRGGNIVIGDSSDVSEGASLYTLSHNIYSKDFSTKKGDITIHERVWICARAVVLPNSTIGKGAVIGINSIVKGSIPEFSLYSENKIIKTLPESRSLDVRKNTFC